MPSLPEYDLAGELEGFTLLEIVMVLFVIGILAATALPKYFDLTAGSDEITADTVANEVQVRLDAKFAAELKAGRSCDVARAEASDISSLADSDGTFRGFEVREGGSRSGSGDQISITVTMIKSDTSFSKTVSLPNCPNGTYSSDLGSDSVGSGSDPGVVPEPNPGTNPEQPEGTSGAAEAIYKFLAGERRENLTKEEKIKADSLAREINRNLFIEKVRFIESSDPNYQFLVQDMETYLAAYHLENKYWLILKDNNSGNENGDFNDNALTIIVTDIPRNDLNAAGHYVEAELYGLLKGAGTQTTQQGFLAIFKTSGKDARLTANFDPKSNKPAVKFVTEVPDGETLYKP